MVDESKGCVQIGTEKAEQESVEKTALEGDGLCGAPRLDDPEVTCNLLAGHPGRHACQLGHGYLTWNRIEDVRREAAQFAKTVRHAPHSSDWDKDEPPSAPSEPLRDPAAEPVRGGPPSTVGEALLAHFRALRRDAEECRRASNTKFDRATFTWSPMLADYDGVIAALEKVVADRTAARTRAVQARELDRLHGRVESHSQVLGNLEVQIARISAHVGAEVLGNLEVQIARISAHVGAVADRVQSHSQVLGNLEGQIARIGGNVGTVAEEVNRLHGRLDTQSAKIETLCIGRVDAPLRAPEEMAFDVPCCFLGVKRDAYEEIRDLRSLEILVRGCVVFTRPDGDEIASEVRAILDRLEARRRGKTKGGDEQLCGGARVVTGEEAASAPPVRR